MNPGSRTLGNRYELSSLLATGGTGQVWRARDTVLNREVAVKILRSEYTGDPAFLARFRAEAQHTAGLTHPNVAALYDYGEVLPDPERGVEHVAYLVMELVDGEPLSMLLLREKPLHPDRTLDLLRQTAAGLAAAHAAGVVHRDVKPGNILVGSDGTIKIADFGIAWSGSSVPLTLTGQVIGTAHYLSPEQAEGAKATTASDVYALGMVAYECLAGRRAFDGENAVQIALRQVRETPEPLPASVPDDLRRLVDSALAKDPLRRPADGAAFHKAVEEVATARGGRPRPGRTAVLTAATPAGTASPPPLPPTEPGVGRHSGYRVLAVAMALVALVMVALGALSTSDPSRSTDSGTGRGPTGTSPSTIQLRAGDHLGRPVADVQAGLSGLELTVELRPIETPDVPAGQVIAVHPVRDLTPGQLVTVTYASAPPAREVARAGGTAAEQDREQQS